MITVDNESVVPVYEQIKSGLRGLLARGFLKPGDQVPAIRPFAETLMLNPNTIARAYRELILEGFLESRRGEGNFVSPKAMKQVENGLGQARKLLLETVHASRRAGLSWREIQTVIQHAKGADDE